MKNMKKSWKRYAIGLSVVALGLGVAACKSCLAQNAPVPDDAVQRITAAAPDRAPARPQRARRLLVFTLAKGFVHSSIPYGGRAMEILGRKTGAFTATVSNDPAMFDAANLGQFDAVCLVSTTGDFLDTPARRQSLLNFVRGGKGLIGIHAATDAFYNWPEFGQMIGGYFSGHPWNANETVGVRIEDKKHPINAAFNGRGFRITDEIYQFKEPYARTRQKVLLSLDMNKTERKGGRADDDYPVSWIKTHGQGRVFYCSLGHREDVYWNPAVLRHYLAGIQYALGDLRADTTPMPKPADEPVDTVMGEYAGRLTTALNEPFRSGVVTARVIAEGGDNYRVAFDDRMNRRTELTGKLDENGRLALNGEANGTTWSGMLQGNSLALWTAAQPNRRYALTKFERRSPSLGARPPAGAVVLLPYVPGTPPSLEAWTNTNWLPLPDGSVQVRGGDNRTKREFGDMRLHLEFMTPHMPEARGQGRGNSGVYLQDRYEVQVLDSFGLPPKDNEVGGIYTVAVPKVNASLPPGQWQTYDMLFRAPRLDAAANVTRPATVTILLNGVVIHDNVTIPRSTGGGAPGSAALGPIRLQDHGNPVRYRNIWALELRDQVNTTQPAATMQPASQDGWKTLFNGRDLTGWSGSKPGGWKIEDGALASQADGGDLWTTEQFGDFVLELEAKVDKGANSGIFIRNPKPGDWYAGMEIQVLDSFGKEKPGVHDSGANYDVLAPSKNMMKAPGEWNRFVITARGNRIQVALNGEQVLDQDLNRWTEAGKNPDGTTNKFKTAYKDMPRAGHIELQEHGSRVWFRNIRIRELK